MLKGQRCPRVGWAFALPRMPAMTAPVPLVSLLTAVNDPRCPQGQPHSLEVILLIATLAVICGGAARTAFPGMADSGVSPKSAIFTTVWISAPSLS